MPKNNVGTYFVKVWTWYALDMLHTTARVRGPWKLVTCLLMFVLQMFKIILTVQISGVLKCSWAQR